jgi:predicted NAD-dependent protein-ADP-ribosyltransferase YbiA (DUF1768 family)
MIESFRGEYAWLSNMTPVNITYDGIEYPSVEHAYMSAKSHYMEWKSRCADGQISARQIKQESKGLILRDDWHEIKLDVMRECIDQKFSQEPYKTQLEETGDYTFKKVTGGMTLFGVLLLKLVLVKIT